MEKPIVYWGILFCTVIGCMELVKRVDGNAWKWSRSEYCFLLWCSGLNSLVICLLERHSSVRFDSGICFSLLAGCLLFACITDWKCCEVFAFTWWIAGGACVILLLQSCLSDYRIVGVMKDVMQQQLGPLLLFSLMQELVFDRFYGKADCHAFVACAAAETALGMGMREFLLHMIMAFGLLAVVQGRRGNINAKGDLKEPVAFLPYITISFWVLLFLQKSVILERISEINLLGGL